MSIIYMWNIKKDTNGLILRTEIDSQTETNFQSPKGIGVRRGK